MILEVLISLVLSTAVIGFNAQATTPLAISEFPSQADGLTVTVLQNEWAMIQQGNSFRYVVTNAASLCTAALFRLADGRAIAVAHFDYASDVNSIDEIVRQLRGISSSAISVVLSSSRADQATRQRIVNKLEELGITIDGTLTSPNLGGDLDGNIYTAQVYSNSLGTFQYREDRLNQSFNNLAKTRQRWSRENPGVDASVYQFTRPMVRVSLVRETRQPRSGWILRELGPGGGATIDRSSD